MSLWNIQACDRRCPPTYIRVSWKHQFRLFRCKQAQQVYTLDLQLEDSMSVETTQQKLIYLPRSAANIEWHCIISCYHEPNMLNSWYFISSTSEGDHQSYFRDTRISINSTLIKLYWHQNVKKGLKTSQHFNSSVPLSSSGQT